MLDIMNIAVEGCSVVSNWKDITEIIKRKSKSLIVNIVNYKQCNVDLCNSGVYRTFTYKNTHKTLIIIIVIVIKICIVIIFLSTKYYLKKSKINNSNYDQLLTKV